MVSDVSTIVLDLVERVGAVAVGHTVTVALRGGDAATVAAWCQRTGNELLSTNGDMAVVRRGRGVEIDTALAAIPPDRRPGARLWLYTNFDCNLACDYCCARSSPKAPRRALGLDTIGRLVDEATECQVAEVFLTGGEPFLLPDVDQIVSRCANQLPTTLLTNGMLFRGRRLELLQRMPRDNLTLQISLDSATPGAHDKHRGAGTWRRAYDGIVTALAAGFRVRVAATVSAADHNDASALHKLLDGLGIARDDQLVRPLARRGFATDGLALTVETLLPEITITADGVYWHPVGADHLDQFVARDPFPLRSVIDNVSRRFAEYRQALLASADEFPCG